MKLKNIKREEGFWSAFVLILLTTLALMGMGAYVLMKSEGVNVASQAESLQTDYSATAAVYYGLRALQLGTFTDGGSITVGGVSVTLDTARIQGGSDSLNVTARTSDGTQTNIGVVLEDVAVWTTGNVTNITIFGNNSNQNSNLVARNSSSVMVMNVVALQATPGAEVLSGNKTINSNHSSTGNTNFYQSDGVTPNVTIVNGNLTVGRRGRLYGIVVVTGNLTIQRNWSSNGRIEGVVYMPTPGSTISMQKNTQIRGGVLSNGDIIGTSSSGSGIIQHITRRLNTFNQPQYKLNPNARWISGIGSWTYQ